MISRKLVSRWISNGILAPLCGFFVFAYSDRAMDNRQPVTEQIPRWLKPVRNDKSWRACFGKNAEVSPASQGRLSLGVLARDSSDQDGNEFEVDFNRPAPGVANRRRRYRLNIRVLQVSGDGGFRSPTVSWAQLPSDILPFQAGVRFWKSGSCSCLPSIDYAGPTNTETLLVMVL
jgi:hypothetical protein